jgi:hypothetical protein
VDPSFDPNPQEDPIAAPRPLITCAADDLAYWSRLWAVEPAVLAEAVRRHGPSVTAVARALDRPDGL